MAGKQHLNHSSPELDDAAAGAFLATRSAKVSAGRPVGGPAEGPAGKPVGGCAEGSAAGEAAGASPLEGCAEDLQRLPDLWS